MKSSALSAEKLGNTKQISPSKNWCFTVFDYGDSEIRMLNSIDSTIVPYFVCQEEKCPSTGRKHLQGWLEFSVKRRPKAVFKEGAWAAAHWEKARAGWRKNRDYCSKLESKNGKTFYRGIEKKYSIQIRNWRPWMTKIIEKIDQEPSEREIIWVWEPDGCCGKTAFCKWLHLNRERVIALSGKAADMKYAVVQYVQKNKCHPRTIILNIPRSVEAQYISWCGIEQLKDMFFFAGKYEGGMVNGPHPHILCMANEEPNYNAMSMDRWCVFDITQD